MFRKQKAGFKWSSLEELRTQTDLTEISPKEGALSGCLWLRSTLME